MGGIAPEKDGMGATDHARRRLMIVSAKLGGGHDAAGRALEEAWRRHWPHSEVRWVDTLDAMGPGVGAAFRWIYVSSVERAPWLYEFFYQATWRYRWFSRSSKLFTSTWAGLRMAGEIDGFEPDAILSTYPLGSGGLAWLRRRRGLAVPVAAWVPDFSPHPFWVHAELDATFVMHEAALPVARASEPSAEVRASALPVSQEFRPGDQATARRRFDLDPDAFVVLVAGGAFGFGIAEPLVRAILDAHERVQVVAVCGRNTAALARLEALGLYRTRLLPLGWVDDMATLNQAADVVVTNAGGATALEAIACGVPVLMAEPIAAHGVANARLMTKAGLSDLCMSKAQVTSRIRAFVTEEGTLRSLRSAARTHVVDHDLAADVASFAPPGEPALHRRRVLSAGRSLRQNAWPMRSADAYFAHVEDANAPQEVGAVLELDPVEDGTAEPVTLQQVREMVAARTRHLPPLHRQLVHRGSRMGWMWHDELDVDAHVTEYPGGPLMSDTATTEAIEEVWSRAAPRDRPAWQVVLFRRGDGGRSLVGIKLHHAMGDGTSALGLLESLLDAEPDEFEPATQSAGRASTSAPEESGNPTELLRGLWHLAARGRAPRHPLNQPLTTDRRSVVFVPLPGKEFRRTAEQFDVSGHELAIGIVGEALERLLAGTGLVAPGRPLRAMIPITRPHRIDRISGNWSGAVPLDLVMGEMSAKERLDRTCAEIRRGLARSEPRAAGKVLRMAGLLPPAALARFARYSYNERFFNLVVSYAPGPRGARRLAGAPVRAIYPILPLSANVPLAVGILTTDDTAAIGLVADRGLGLVPAAVVAATQGAFREFVEA